MRHLVNGSKKSCKSVRELMVVSRTIMISQVLYFLYIFFLSLLSMSKIDHDDEFVKIRDTTTLVWLNIFVIKG